MNGNVLDGKQSFIKQIVLITLDGCQHGKGHVQTLIILDLIYTGKIEPDARSTFSVHSDRRTQRWTSFAICTGTSIKTCTRALISLSYPSLPLLCIASSSVIPSSYLKASQSIFDFSSVLIFCFFPPIRLSKLDMAAGRLELQTQNGDVSLDR